MINFQIFFPILLSIFLLGCSSPSPAKTPTASPTESVPSSSENIPILKGQQLPISSVAILPNGTKIQLEVAKTQEQQSMGLMYRPALPNNRGMLFPFPSAQPVSFWMKNVPVALDMVFMRQGVVQAVIPKVPPCKKDPCPTYGPRTTIDTVIELRSGHAAEISIKKGDKIQIQPLDTKKTPSSGK
jgi:uncharacterized protein